MLHQTHAIFEYRNGEIHPDRLTRKTHGQYLSFAEKLLTIYRRGSGRTRQELHRAVRRIFELEDDCPPRRIDALCKLLDERSTFARDVAGQAAALRKQVFEMAAKSHPLVKESDHFFHFEEAKVKAQIAKELGRPWTQIEQSLYADIADYQRLESFEGYPDARALLSRYNVAQVQVALYRALEMRIHATADLKTILRYAKLAGLMHSLTRTSQGRYEILFDGPASLLRETHRYGTAMARFLPAVLACRGWRLHARIATPRPGWSVALNLTPQDGLTSHLPPPEEFDSSVEEHFARRWGSEPREGWRLAREGEVLVEGQRFFVPDFAFYSESGQTVLMEIVGFYTPDYLEAKLQTLERFRHQPVLLAIAERVGGKLPELPQTVICYKTALRIERVLEALRAVKR